MNSSIQVSSLLFIFLISVKYTICWNVDEFIGTLFEKIDSSRVKRNVDQDAPNIWMEYEFNTGAGNREELVVKDVSTHEFIDLPNTETKWQYLNAIGSDYLFRAEESTIYYYEVDLDKICITYSSSFDAGGNIISYRVVSLQPEMNLIVLCMESRNATTLQWYKLEDEHVFKLFWSWPVLKRIKDIQFIQRRKSYQILLLNDEEINFGPRYSAIDVYGFYINFPKSIKYFWLYDEIPKLKTDRIQVCPIHETASLAIQGSNHVLLYEDRNVTEGSSFREFQTVKSYNLSNFVCFESGYLSFLAISGPEAGLFHFVDEFQFSTESESNFDFSEIAWIESIRPDTYREESLLLMQLKNSTVLALSWQGFSFKGVRLPNKNLDQFDLSKIIPIPKYGFIHGNRLVKIHVQLKDVIHPIQYSTRKLLILQSLLEDTLNHQDRILNETEARIEKSYLKNPVTGFWNISVANVTNVTLADNVTFDSITLGSTDLTPEDLPFDIDNFEKHLKNLEEKLIEIESNFAKANSTELDFDSDIEIFGDINFSGNLTVENLTAEFINGVSMNDSLSHDQSTTIEETFDFIQAENLTVISVNGIPVEDILFTDIINDYRHVNFSGIKKAEVIGDIFFSTINGIDWNILMRDIVWIDEHKVIPGDTVIEGTLTTDTLDVNKINDLKYPEDYVLAHGNGETIVTGFKTFNTLITSNLEDVITLNGLNFDEYVVLHKHNVLKSISFENLTIDHELRIDCEIEGFNQTNYLLLNETNQISSDVTFMNLTVSGNVTFNSLIVDKKLLNLNDLLLKTGENVEITGTKTFLGNVEMKSVSITSGMINGHLIEDFVTYDTEQTFPNLTKILANVTFGNVTFGAIEKLEAFFEDNKNADNCLEKILIFKYPIVVEELTFNTINKNTPYEEFNRKLNESLTNVIFENLIVENITANEIVAKTINGVDFGSLMKNVSSCEIIDEHIDHLETNYLNVTFINGIHVNEINQLIEKLDEILNNVRNASSKLETLQVTGLIKTNSINGIAVKDLYNASDIDTIIFKEGVSIRNFTLLGFMNGFNFLERVADTILNDDRDIVLEGHKVFQSNVSCYQLETDLLNGRPIKNILDPSKEQILLGPVVINGTITVSNDFNVTGKINHIPFANLTNRFKPVGTSTYEFNDGINFLNNVTVQNLETTGLIQGKNFTEFLDTVIYKDEDDVIITGTKIFKNNVIFNKTFVVNDRLNDLDLKRFFEKAVFIDKPFSIKSKVIFKDAVKVEKDIIVKTNLEAKSIMGIDLEDLKKNVMNVNRPNHIDGTITFRKVEFLSNIKVDMINDIDMKLLLPLKTEQTIPVEILRCRDVTVEKVQIFGRINNENLKKIQENTFMLTGDQNITGNINFHGHVVAQDLKARLINGIDPTRFIPLNTEKPITGNFVFEKPVVFHRNLQVFGYLNGINPKQWEAEAVSANNSLKQTISGRWTVHGNVYFENGAEGSDMLNGTNITELSNLLAKKHLEMHSILAETSVNLHSVCEDLNHLKHYAERQIYQFNVFDYLQVMEHNSIIVSSHYFELDDLDYLILSYDDCQMHMYQFNGERFELVASIPDFGVTEKWSTFERDQTLYFLTLGRISCGRSPVNLWKLKDDVFEFVLDLGHKINRRDVNQDMFLSMVDEIERLQSSDTMNEEFEKSLLTLANDNMKFNDDLLQSMNEAYENNVESQDTSLGKYFGKPETLKFNAGFLKKEMYLYYDEELSKNRIFICSKDAKRDKILQTIPAHRPSSFVVFSFEGSFETLLIFMENRKILQIYEYKGIQGFVYRDSIKINANKLFSFTIRKNSNFAKRRCVGLVDDKTLSILEAEMYGEKLDIGTLKCSVN